MDYKKEEIREHLEDYCNEHITHNGLWDFFDKYTDEWTELHHEVFNTDYYIIGTNRAVEWMGNKAFQIIEFIKEYEQDNFGEVYTDLSSPEKLVNMYAYIIGEQVVQEYFNELEEA